MIRVLAWSVFLAVTAASASGQELEIPARLSLEEALRLANGRNADLAAARNAVEVAEAGRTGARLKPNPAVSFESEGYPLFEPEHPSFINNQELTVRYDQEIELAGRRRLRTEAAEGGVSAAEATFRDQERRLAFEVRRAYFTVVLAKADLEVARGALEEIDKVIGLNRARYQQGEISGGELRRIQVERLRFVDDQFAARLAWRNARSSLLALLNASDLGAEFDVVDNLGSADSAGVGGQVVPRAPTAPDTATLRAQALASRPDLLAAQREAQRADTETRLQRALRTPNITIGGGYKRDFGVNAVVFGVTVPLPFYKNEGGLARAEAEQRQAANLAAATATRVLLDVQQAINAIDVARARVDYIEREYLKPSRESRDIVLASYRLGTANLIDFLDAQRAFRDTARTYNRALYEERISTFALAAAIGTSTIQP